MPDTNLEELKKISQFFNGSKIMTPDDIKAILRGIVNILATYKRQTSSLNDEAKNDVKKTVSTFAKQWNVIIDRSLKEMQQYSDSSAKKFADSLAEVKALLKQVEKMKPKDGEKGMDADEQKIIDAVMAKMQQPKNEKILKDTPEDIADKLESLEGDKRLKASAIYGLVELIESLMPKAGARMVGGNGGGVQSIESPSGLTVDSSLYKENDKRKGKGAVRIYIPVQDTPPDNPFEGQLWVDTS